MASRPAASKPNVFEKQATLSVGCAALAGLFILAAIFLVFRGFNAQETAVIMQRMGRAHIALMASIGIAGLAGLVGVYLGFVSAGQTRNKRSRLSWMGFFLNAVAITLALSTFAFFWLTQELQTRN